MADQNAAADQAAEHADSSVQETGTQEAAVQENWEQRFKDTQAWATRLTQEKAELEAEAQLAKALRSDDPAAQRKALEALGYTVPEEEEEDSQVYEPDPRLRAELDELKQWKNSLTETEQREQNYAQYREQFDPKLKELGVPDAFLQNVADIAYNQLDAVQTPNGPQPDLQGAVKWFKEVAEMFADVPEVQTKVRKSWADSKPTRALTSPSGQEGSSAPNIDEMTQEERHAHMAQMLADRNAAD